MEPTPVPQTYRLSDAVRLHTVTTDRFKTARLNLYTVFPMDRWKSPLMTLLFGVMRRGTAGYPTPAAVNRHLNDLYGTVIHCRNFQWGDRHVIGFAAEMMEDAYRPADDRETDILGGTIDLLSRFLLHPLIDDDGLLSAEAVQREAQELCDSIRAEANQPRTLAENKYHEHLYAGEPYALSLLGEVEDVMMLTPRQVTETWRAWLSCARVEVFYVGQASPEEVKRKWQTAFAGWEPSLPELPPMQPHPVPPSPRYFEEEAPVAQGRLCMGWSGGPTEKDGPVAVTAAMLLDQMLGNMPSSLLFRHVREEMGLCYACDSSYQTGKGVLTVSCGIRSENRTAAEQAISAQLESIRRGKITEADLELARTSLEMEYRRVGDSTRGLEHFWRWQILLGDDYTPEERIRTVREVTLARVIDVAARLRPDTVFFLRGSGVEEDEDTDEDNWDIISDDSSMDDDLSFWEEERT